MRKTAKLGNKFPQLTFLNMMGPTVGETSPHARLCSTAREGSPLSLLARLAPHLPYVRRYARALTGDQTTGDHYVRVALEALAAGERVLDPNLTPRVALYHVFHAIWCSSGAQLETPGEEDQAADDTTRRLMRIAPRSRQAFLLTALEGFTPSEAAQILGTDFGEVEKLIAEAQAEIDAELATDVLIIEDEPVIAADIEALVKELGHSVVDIAATRTEAIDAVARKTPGLVLADIQLADGSSGIDAVKDILARFDVPVIFITAFPERLLTGERPEPTFLITKPFQPETVKAAIGQALFFHPRKASKQAA
jgi:DNA-directed RNA polymerase specialized sigma24 family protein